VSDAQIRFAVIGAVFGAVGIVWLIVDPKRLPEWLRSRHRVLFGILALVLAAFLIWSATLTPVPEHRSRRPSSHAP